MSPHDRRTTSALAALTAAAAGAAMALAAPAGARVAASCKLPDLPPPVVVAPPAPASPTPAPATPGSPTDQTPAPVTPPTPPTPAPAPAAPTVSYPPVPTSAVGRSVATVAGIVDPGGSLTVYRFVWGTGTAYGSCGPVGRLDGSRGPATVRATLTGLRPGTTYHFALVAASAGGPATGDDQPFTTSAPPPPPVPRLPGGTTILGVPVGGLTQEAALAAVNRAFQRPLHFSYRGRNWAATPAQLGAHAYVVPAVQRALAAETRAVPVTVRVDGSRVRSYVHYLDGLFSKPAAAADVRLVGKHAQVVAAKPGVAVDTDRATSAIVRALTQGSRGTIALPVRATVAKGTGVLSIVVRLGAQSLVLYRDGHPVLTTPVTTGRSLLPTPIGSYAVQWRSSPYVFHSPWPKGNPFWYPPTTVNMAMLFYDGDFLHDDPGEPLSAFGPGSQYGPYASHGCVHVPYSAMRTLFTKVPDHTPVIVAQT